MEKPQVVLHRLSGVKKALDACKLVEKLYQAGEKVVVWFLDEGKAAIFDQYLWTFSDTAFVPHRLAPFGSLVEEPVALVVGTLHNPNGATTLVVMEHQGKVSEARIFPKVHDLIAANEDPPSHWERSGFAVTEVKGV